MQPDDLRAKRKLMELTQGDLAASLGLTTTFIGLMERGTKKIERRTELAVLYLVEHPEARLSKPPA
jgi:predicted transcriptional regulator